MGKYIVDYKGNKKDCTVHEGKDGTIFLVTENKILVQTRLQEFYLDPEEWYNKEDLDMMAYFIQSSKICDMPSLRRRIRGLFYLQTSNKRHIVYDR